MNLTKLGDINYSHLKVDGDLKNEKVNDALLQDLQKAGKAANVVLTITTAKSDHEYNVSNSDRRSRHMDQTAVDIAKLDGIGSNGASSTNPGNPEFRKKGNKVKDALVAMGYDWNTEKGNPKAILWQTNTGGNHYNHLHVSNNSGESSSTDSSNTNIDDVVDNLDGMEEKPSFTQEYIQKKFPTGFFDFDKIVGSLKEEVQRIKNLMK